MSAPLVHPTVAAVKAIHAEVLAAHGGMEGLREEALLESAVAAPQATMFGKPLLAEPIDVAAAALGLQPWLLIPGAFVLLAVMMFNFVGDGLRDDADPYATCPTPADTSRGRLCDSGSVTASGSRRGAGSSPRARRSGVARQQRKQALARPSRHPAAEARWPAE